MNQTKSLLDINIKQSKLKTGTRRLRVDLYFMIYYFYFVSTSYYSDDITILAGLSRMRVR